MGMTISEAISKLRYELNKNNKMANAYVMAIDIMRKYQKIEKIVADRGLFIDDKYFLIREVVEDEKD